MPELLFKPLSAEEMRNREYVQAQLAVMSLTIAWRYTLNLQHHDEAAEHIERALESTMRMRERIKGRKF